MCVCVFVHKYPTKIMNLRAKLFISVVDHQGKYVLVTGEPSPSHLPNHAPLPLCIVELYFSINGCLTYMIMPDTKFNSQ